MPDPYCGERFGVAALHAVVITKYPYIHHGKNGTLRGLNKVRGRKVEGKTSMLFLNGR
jgi:hypothetical protein